MRCSNCSCEKPNGFNFDVECGYTLPPAGFATTKQDWTIQRLIAHQLQAINPQTGYSNFQSTPDLSLFHQVKELLIYEVP